jgi:hypothetical protein
MATQYANGKIVTDGLVLCLDASDKNSYPGSGTTWTNVAGTNNGTLTNGPTFNSANGGSIVFDGSNDYISTGYNTQLQDFTAIAWFKSGVAGARYYERILDKSYDTGFWMGRNYNQSNKWGGGIRNTTAPDYGIFLTLSDSNWHFLTMIRSGTTQILYGDGISNTTSTTCSGTQLSSTNLSIGTDFSNGYILGNIASVQIYNRALSASEVLQNYNAQKSRFNL